MRGLAFGYALLALAALALGDSSSFFEVDEEFHRRNRELLQDYENPDDVEVSDDDGGEDEEEERRPKEPVYSTEPSNGPTLFYDDTKNFLMEVKPGIAVNFYEAESNSTKPIAKVVLDQRATSVKGSMTSDRAFTINLEWKGIPMDSTFGNLRLESIMIKMTFLRTAKEWRLENLEASKTAVAGANLLDSQTQVKSSYGYKVTAPLGLTFCCADPGVFRPASAASGNRYKVGLSFPGLRLMVFDVPNTKFGPDWYCGEMMSIGLLVGVIITLFFAIICCYGFSMLASINTMDRFDDPKGKPIHVPQTE